MAVCHGQSHNQLLEGLWGCVQVTMSPSPHSLTIAIARPRLALLRGSRVWGIHPAMNRGGM
eukprot:973013-Amphidinium_carterae.1